MFLTLGLNARAGAFFVLPALLLWAVLAYRQNGVLAWRQVGWGGAGMSIGFLLNALLLWVFGTGDNMAHSNFSFTLYGLAVGGKGWLQVYSDHPEIRAISSERVAAQYIYELAMQAIVADPKPFFSAYLKGLEQYWLHFFQFIEEIRSHGHEGDIPDIKLIPLFKVLSVFAMICAVVRAGDRRIQQLLFVMVGVFVSAPILSEGGARVFAATMPYIAVCPAMGLFFLSSIGRPHGATAGPGVPASGSSSVVPHRPLVAVLAGSFLALLSVVGPMLAVVLYERPKFAQPSCENGLLPVIIRFGEGATFLKILPENSEATTHVPEIRYKDYAADSSFGNNEIAPVLRDIRPGSWIILGYDLSPVALKGWRLVWLVADESASLPAPGKFVQVCGRQDTRATGYQVLHVQSTRVVEPSR
jgi:hypothetical protein